ncbi:MAG: AEC family transporter [Actinomycetaceae bacterium]|nr:AEC family transporter [Actinomycetaceae bacterium]
MGGVLSGLSVVWAVIILGWFLGRVRLLGDSAQLVLNRLVYFIALPAYIGLALAQADVQAVFGQPLLVAAVSALVTATVFALLGRFVLHLRIGDTVIGAMSSALTNAGYLGIPLSHYILGSTTHVIPVLLFQLGFFSPMFFVLADLASGRGDVTMSRVVRTVLRNPLVYAAIIGSTISLSGWHLPTVVVGPIELVAGAAVPCILIAFGLSLAGEKMTYLRPALIPIALATAAKLLFQPLVAVVFAHVVLGASGFPLFAYACMAGLPTAQNAYLAAFRAETGETLARGTVIASTVFATPSLMAIAALLA